MKRIRNTLGILLLLLVSHNSYALGDPALGKDKAARCIECHATDGNNPDPKVPRLTGQLPDYLLKQMLEFVSGHRKDHVMSSMIKEIKTTDGLTDIAAYYANLPVMSGSGTQTALGQQGKKLYMQERCMYCHNFTGRPDDTFAGGAPVIGGQSKGYLVKVLLEIRSGERKADMHDLMKKTLAKQSDQHIEAIAEFLSNIK